MPAPRPHLRVAFDLPSAVPGVWHADALGAGSQPAQPTGYALLDAQLPGGGWPVGALSEVLQPMAGLHEWQLVLPALAQAAARRVHSYHEAQKKASGESWTYRDEHGSLLGQKVTPLDRVGIYVPGGKAA